MEILEGGYGILSLSVKGSDNNYNYILWCAETLESVVIDPLDAAAVLGAVKERGLRVKYIINTHTHPDHIGGNERVQKSTNAIVLVHPSGKGAVSSKALTVEEGDTIDVGRQKINVIHTPGHCPEHISLIHEENIFVGDTLFLAGCGNTKHRGDVDELYNSIALKIRPLPESLRVFVGHDYSLTNLRFDLNIEPENSAAESKLSTLRSLSAQGREDPPPPTIGEEKTYNPFLRFDTPSLVAEMKTRNSGLEDDPRMIFKELRKLRDSWK